MNIKMEGTESEKSEWNEQKLYAYEFFKITNACRQHQANFEVIHWYNHLISKMSLVMGACNDTEKDNLNKFREDLREEYRKLHNFNGRNKKKLINNLYDACFFVEAKIDTVANKKMPFLRIKRGVDIEGL